ncbi:(Na+)-NQR maturation NqrM [Motiliproteus sp. MSK22-1]|uniref:(Na+)-NQR maturation NqrM n=1 Tax=Motiliproteus sp. MSK22-1 TaxID=1897630 RepID=UPI0009777CE5|nr:(Na+)-NQR maturation NqrM [Motiliproteus sp. MSK22-1]OMH33700.1 hypothetical protein BGP75_11895 [Motiliproteus sp. MSK22-1]
METVILAVVVLAIFILAMSVGVIMGRKPIKGSCGGVGAALGEKDYICPVCGDDPDKCENENEQEESMDANALGYELSSVKAK